jgi:hypothetical protein
LGPIHAQIERLTIPGAFGGLRRYVGSAYNLSTLHNSNLGESDDADASRRARI